MIANDQQRPLTDPLTIAVLDFTRRFIASHKYAPSLREIAPAVYCSPTSVNRHLDLLMAAGYITRDTNVPRSIVLCQPAGLSIVRPPRKPLSGDRLHQLHTDIHRRAMQGGAANIIPVDSLRALLDYCGWSCQSCGQGDSPDNQIALRYVFPVLVGRMGQHSISNMTVRCTHCTALENSPAAWRSPVTRKRTSLVFAEIAAA